MLGERIKRRLDDLDWTQADLARATGFSTGYIADLVNNKRGKRLSVENMLRLSKALKVRPSFFYGQNSNMRETGVRYASR